MVLADTAMVLACSAAWNGYRPMASIDQTTHFLRPAMWWRMLACADRPQYQLRPGDAAQCRRQAPGRHGGEQLFDGLTGPCRGGLSKSLARLRHSLWRRPGIERIIYLVVVSLRGLRHASFHEPSRCNRARLAGAGFIGRQSQSLGEWYGIRRPRAGCDRQRYRRHLSLYAQCRCGLPADRRRLVRALATLRQGHQHSPRLRRLCWLCLLRPGRQDSLADALKGVLRSFPRKRESSSDFSLGPRLWGTSV